MSGFHQFWLMVRSTTLEKSPIAVEIFGKIFIATSDKRSPTDQTGENMAAPV
jgi:hypothetical protein